MHEDNFRKNGGIGLAVNFPDTAVLCKVSNDFCIDIPLSFDYKIKERVLLILESIYIKFNMKKKIHIELGSGYKSHVGLGVSTAVTLSSIEALLKLNNIEYTNDEIVSLSTRGGTSGIGVSSYFTGGLVVDLGTINDGFVHIPSSYSIHPAPPPILRRCDFPDWRIWFCLPLVMSSFVSGIEEKEFFENNTPIPESESYKAFYLSVMGLMGSAIESNYEGACLAINRIQNTFWKKSEIRLCEKQYASFYESVKSLKVNAFGQSSFGPGQYLLSKDDLFMPKDKGSILEIVGLDVNNIGRTTRYV
jgi:beta-ribofuranosylaminobenzene 5'-phosphate synthase